MDFIKTVRSHKRFCWILSILKVNFTIFSVKAMLLCNKLKRKKHTFDTRLVAFILHSEKTNLLGPRRLCNISLYTNVVLYYTIILAVFK